MRLQLLRATALQAPVSGPLCSLRRLPSPPTSRTLPPSPSAHLTTQAPAGLPSPEPSPRGTFGSTFGSTFRGNFGRAFRSSTRGSVRMAAEGAEASEGLVAGHTEENCIFCKIRDGVIPSTKILETEHAFAILDAFPMTRGHTLLIPKKHYAFLEDVPADEAAAVMQELPKLAKAVRIATGAKGVNVAQNNGTVAGQVVFHVHIHILPRVEGDGLLKLGKSGGMIEASEAAAVKEAIVAALPASSL